MVFFAIDFSREIDAVFSKNYILGMPAPKGVIIISAPQNVIVNRIRTRAEKGWVGTLHRPIIHSDELLNQWVSKACKTVDFTRAYFN